MARVARVERALRRHGARFAERILCPDERREWRANPRPGHFIARRFAAKEATAKAFGTGIGRDLAWQDIEVVHGPRGQPELAFSAASEALRTSLRLQASHLSLADDGDYAIAFVVLVGASL